MRCAMVGNNDLGLHGSVLTEKPETFVGLEESFKDLKIRKKNCSQSDSP